MNKDFVPTHSCSTLAAWMPVVCALVVLCGESTNTMSASHTGLWLNRLVASVTSASVYTGELNHVLRKGGHFLGYGTVGLLYLRGWLSVCLARIHTAGLALVRTRSAAIFAACFAILSTALTACLDELHQRFLPDRTSSISDVLLDTAGAILLVSLATAVVARHSRLSLRLLLHEVLATSSRTAHASAAPSTVDQTA